MTSERAAIDASPPRWAEKLARFFLQARDRDTVTGDLLEEYREVVLPAKGRFRAQLWYFRQALSLVLVNPFLFGIILGVLFGAWNIAYSLLLPLAEDTVVAVFSFYGLMFLMPGIAGFAAFRATGRWLEAIKAAVTVAVVIQVVFGGANMIRVNLLLDTLTQRSDWQHLVARFRSSEFDSFRAFVNYDYAKQTAPKLAAVTLIGAVFGILGGLFATLFGRRRLGRGQTGTSALRN